MQYIIVFFLNQFLNFRSFYDKIIINPSKKAERRPLNMAKKKAPQKVSTVILLELVSRTWDSEHPDKGITIEVPTEKFAAVEQHLLKLGAIYPSDEYRKSFRLLVPYAACAVRCLQKKDLYPITVRFQPEAESHRPVVTLECDLETASKIQSYLLHMGASPVGFHTYRVGDPGRVYSIVRDLFL